MSTRMLIDARHSEETRVTIVKGSRVEEFDYESATRKQLKGNIYLARVTRVEPSLQAAFVEYGGNRHGFLAFSEIHPDYYQIPVEDREALLAAEAAAVQAQAKEEEEDVKPKRRRRRRSSSAKVQATSVEVSEAVEEESEETSSDETTDVATVETQDIEALGEDADIAPAEVQDSDEEEKDAAIEEAVKRRNMLKTLKRKYNIQEVIKRRQVLLIQVVKEERGNKGAALTTYLSLAGRYCVLMPNSTHSGGISRKISNMADRKKLKQVISDLEVPDDMGLIVRTAGMQRTKAEIKRDYDYLLRLWNGIRDLTLQSTAPALIYEEGNLIKRTIRDLYSRDVDEILVEGDEGYRMAKDFMKLLMPSHAKKVQHYKDRIPLFHRYQVESHLDAMYQPVVQLRSGGYLVINPTEALISIDVNSGRATKEHNIEETALKTNLEAADEVARQLRLRDMAGLVVIDFIDMEDRSNNRAVERRMKDVLKSDRARIQVGRISSFGLMEMSRQRMRPNLLEITMETCPHCSGAGIVRSVETAALMTLRQLEEEGIRNRSSVVRVSVSPEVAIYILNKKRTLLTELEERYRFSIEVLAKTEFGQSDIELTREASTGQPIEEITPETVVTPSQPQQVTSKPAEPSNTAAEEATTDGQPKRRRRRRRRRRRGGDETGTSETLQETAVVQTDEAAEPVATSTETEDDAEDKRPARRRRGSRGGRKRRTNNVEGQTDIAVADEKAETPATEPEKIEVVSEPVSTDEEAPKPKRRTRARKPAAVKTDDSKTESTETAEAPASATEADEKPKRRTRTRKKVDETSTESPETPVATEATDEKPKRRRAPAKKAPKSATETSEAVEAEKPKRRTRTTKKVAAADTAASSEKEPPVKSEVKAAANPEPQAPASAGAESNPDAPKRKGWWQRTFG